VTGAQHHTWSCCTDSNSLELQLLSPRLTESHPPLCALCTPGLQAFHTLYHTDESVLLGAPTGSGKTISSELTMLRVFSTQPDRKIIYIAPLKVGAQCHLLLQYIMSDIMRWYGLHEASNVQYPNAQPKPRIVKACIALLKLHQ
jgi:hypothetical protein